MSKIRWSRKFKNHAMQPDEKIDAILDLLEALCEKQGVNIPEWIRKTERPHHE